MLIWYMHPLALIHTLLILYEKKSYTTMVGINLSFSNNVILISLLHLTAFSLLQIMFFSTWLFSSILLVSHTSGLVQWTILCPKLQWLDFKFGILKLNSSLHNFKIGFWNCNIKYAYFLFINLKWWHYIIFTHLQ